jgi:uncharacterized protein YyaL (SSP411 family)
MHTNHLINETSVYLLQHAHNPVDWFAWSEEALQKAKVENKPILVSIGYAACHWCHVMERESFENEETAALMNEFFVNIKVDREEHPDLDYIYMDAVQAMTGSGGWPLNVFLTPEGKPFYGGTYFPPKPAYGRTSWQDVLKSINEAWTQRKNEIESQAENLTAHLINANNLGLNKGEKDFLFTKENADEIAKNILQNADKIWGGFGNAPKFPQTFCISYLLRHYYFTKEKNSLDQALLSLNKMSNGGIYDHLGGGFARYSTDTEWLAPHFEKMLYDNALILIALSEAYQITRDDNYANTIRETMDFIKREILTEDNGFYSAIDADSEGVEGKFYTWNKKEIENILQNDAELFCKVYDVSENGNWEHVNILRLLKPLKEKAIELNIEENIFQQKIKIAKQKLLKEREKRIRPLTDDKILLGWNALMVKACCKSYAALQDEEYLSIAEKNISFLEEKFKNISTGEWFHTWKNDVAKYPAFLDDYAFLIDAYIHLQEVSGNEKYLMKAKELVEFVIENFQDEASSFFSFTKISQENILLRKKEIYDGATASGNAVMAENLFYLSIIFDKKEWQLRAEQMLQSIGKAILRYPSSFGVWASLLQNIASGMNEIAIVGSDAIKNLQEINSHFYPNKILQSAEKAHEYFPLLKSKGNDNGDTLIFLCRRYKCLKPVKNVDELAGLLEMN